MIWFFLSLILFVGVFSSALIVEKIEFAFYWNKGLIPPWKRDKEHTRIHIYISLAALLLKEQPVEKHPKLETLYKFILRNKSGRFPLAERDSYFNKVKNMLKYAAAHPLKLESAGEWLMRHNFPEQKRLQIIRFLAEFASVNGQVDSSALEIISRFSDLVSISEAQLQEILHKLKEKQQEESDRKKKPKGTNITELAKCCAILGVSHDAGLKEIKRAYKKLAQASHPDRFANASKSEYDAAHNRFIEIQRAYEVLEKMLSSKQ